MTVSKKKNNFYLLGKMVVLTALSTFAVTPSAIAQTGNDLSYFVTSSGSNACVCNPADPFDPQARMPKGTFKGQCLNCEQRAVKLLSPSEAAPYKPAPGSMVLANFKHKGKFWVAQIPRNAVADAIFQIQYYSVLRSPYSAHGQLRFRLKPGYEAILVPQSKTTSGVPKAVRVRDIVYVANGIGVKSAGWNPISGLIDFYAIAQEITALEDRVIDAAQFPFTDRVEQIRLALTPQQKQQLLINAIHQSDREGTSVMYDTLNRNCTTESLRIIDRTIGYNPKILPQEQQEYFVSLPMGVDFNQAALNRELTSETLNEFLAEQIKKMPPIQLPTAPYDAIVRRGLVNSQSKLPNLEQEFAAEFKNKKR
ncbi:DUF4105 domain-containing protein [Chroococcidiopsis thermalis]|uniref:Lnb N-terminal periplasmic domain-containing protein n=1 Tax=Chroococcidiopsis thermalis (strain PCC 7203) TaxID=251229 RepID=K9U4S0_CHRTP|nr:DUF4105 domain-containing protein [Chroococcidiopsis thermalis]AFY89416.1 hypothetical protein Chro_4011 [Chroococcidiopsis thermalis PCC 7203]PSB44922.1 DUF4105 domain-containing protein [Cyanosarcina cf. burmensis CCALA 770]